MTVLETIHPLALDDRHAETALLAGIHAHFASFDGTMRDAYEP